MPNPSFIQNVNNIAAKLSIIEEANSIFDDGVIPILEEIADLDLQEAVLDLKKGNYLGNRKVDINLALNMVGITEDLIEKNPAAAEAIWVDPTKTVQYSSATVTFTDGVVIALPFIFDGSPTTISTHADLLAQLSRLDYVTAIAQVSTVGAITAVNSTVYTVTIDGTVFSYTSDIDATVLEITAGLAAVINLGIVPVTAVATATTVVLTADVAGAAFNAYVNGNMTVTPTIVNRVAGPVETAFLAKLNHTLLASFASDVVGEIIRGYDVTGQNSNLERIQLHTVSGQFIDPNPIYFWAKTTSAFQTLSMRTGDIIKLGNDIDSIILLTIRITEMLELQAQIPAMVTNVDSLYANIAKLVVIHANIAALANINTNITALSAINTNMTNLNEIVAQIIPNIAEILAADTNAATATAKALEAFNSAAAALASQQSAATSAQTATTKANSILTLTASASTLVTGSLASASYNPTNGVMTFGIPVGATGAKGDPFVVNAQGLFATRSTYDTQPTSFSFFATDLGLIYFKNSATSGDWSIGSPFGKGDKGDTGNGITSITLTGTVGSVDTYRVLYTDATFFDFTVTNGSVVSVAGKTGAVVLTKADVGLANVDNTTDLLKPISTATQSALDWKLDDAHIADDDHTQYHNDTRGDVRYYTKSANDTLLNSKQATLASGTNIKTINGVSVLGSGDMVLTTEEIFQLEPLNQGAEYTQYSIWSTTTSKGFLYTKQFGNSLNNYYPIGHVFNEKMLLIAANHIGGYFANSNAPRSGVSQKSKYSSTFTNLVVMRDSTLLLKVLGINDLGQVVTETAGGGDSYPTQGACAAIVSNTEIFWLGMLGSTSAVQMHYGTYSGNTLTYGATMYPFNTTQLLISSIDTSRVSISVSKTGYASVFMIPSSTLGIYTANSLYVTTVNQTPIDGILVSNTASDIVSTNIITNSTEGIVACAYLNTTIRTRIVTFNGTTNTLSNELTFDTGHKYFNIVSHAICQISNTQYAVTYALSASMTFITKIIDISTGVISVNRTITTVIDSTNTFTHSYKILAEHYNGYLFIALHGTNVQSLCKTIKL